MRIYHTITLVLAIICLFGDCGQSAPVTGRYMWVTCKPDGRNPNCVTQKGPVVALTGLSTRLPPSAVKDIKPVNTEEATPETEEQSGEGSGSEAFMFLSNKNQDKRDATEQEANKNEEEGSTFETSGDFDYSSYVFPQKISSLSAEDLKEESMIA